MSEDTSFAADLSAALSDTSPQGSGDVPAAPVDDTVQPEAATIAPTVEAAVSPNVDPTPKPQGPIPFDVHSTALKNAREKARAEYEAEWDQQYGWAKSVDREAAQKAAEIGQFIQRDPAGYVRQLLADSMSDPNLAAVVRSEAARILAQGRGQPAGQPVDLTPIDIDLGNGQVVPFFTADQFQAALEQRMAKFEQKFAPALTAADELRTQKEEAAATKWGQTLYGEVSKLPTFKEHEKDIALDVARQIGAYPKGDPRANSPEFLEAAVLKAYNRIALPHLQTAGRRAELTQQQAQAAATTVNPARSGVNAPKTFEQMSLSEAIAAEIAAG